MSKCPDLIILITADFVYFLISFLYFTFIFVQMCQHFSKNALHCDHITVITPLLFWLKSFIWLRLCSFAQSVSLHSLSSHILYCQHLYPQHTHIVYSHTYSLSSSPYPSTWLCFKANSKRLSHFVLAAFALLSYWMSCWQITLVMQHLVCFITKVSGLFISMSLYQNWEMKWDIRERLCVVWE